MGTPDPIQLSPEPLQHELSRLGSPVERLNKPVRCCFHDDKHPSASISNKNDSGIWRLHCFVCGKSWDVFDLRAAAEGKPLEDVLREHRKIMTPTPVAAPSPAPAAKEEPPRLYDSLKAIREIVPGKMEGEYKYTNPDTGKIDLTVWRFVQAGEKKQFWQGRPWGDNGHWALKGLDINPIYNRTRLRAVQNIIVVEGEKKVHALHDIGIVATTAPGGAKAVQKADWTPLKGKTVWLWPDNDAPGAEAMQTVKGILEGLGCTVYVIDASTLGLPEKGDVVDFLDTLSDLSLEGKRKAIQDVMDDALPDTPGQGVGQLIEDMISGKWQNIYWPWNGLSRLARALFPKTVTVICGDAGTTKSYFLLEAMCFWHQHGRKIALFEMEEDRTYHLHRALSFLSGNSVILDDEWVKGHPVESRAEYETHRAMLDSFGACMDDAPDQQKTLADLLEWLEAKAASGCEIVAIDPVTAAKTELKPWEADHNFIMTSKTIARRHACRVILVTHPKKARSGKAQMSELAGGASYERFPQGVLWMQSMNPPETLTVSGAMGHVGAEVNRKIKICKARNARGQGLELAYYFDPETMRFTEHGIIIED